MYANREAVHDDDRWPFSDVVAAPASADSAPPAAPTARQVGGDHYRTMPIQPWDAMRAWQTPAQFAGFLHGNCIKYLARFNATGAGKGGLDDLRKAAHYLSELITLEEAGE